MPWWDCDPVLQSKEQERKPLTYSGARPISIPVSSPKGNGGETAAARTLRRDTASNGLIAVRRAARQSKSVRFTALLHHITIDLLKRSYLSLERDSGPGIDGVTWQTYEKNLEERLENLHAKGPRASYQARPPDRTSFPKVQGSKQRRSILC